MTEKNIEVVQRVAEIKKEEISLKELFIKIKEWIHYFKSKWVIILIAGIIGSAIGFWYSYSQQPTYTATLTFALEDENSKGSGGLSSLANLAGIDLGNSAGGAFSSANLMELMVSRRLVEQTLLKPVIINLKETTLAQYYIDMNRKGNLTNFTAFEFSPNEDRKTFSIQKDSVLGSIYREMVNGIVSVSQKDKRTNIITIEVVSKNEMFSKVFTESLAKEVSEFYINTKSEKARANVRILEHQADSIKHELNSAITGVSIVNDNNYNLNPALSVKRAPVARRQVDVQANTMILTQVVTNLELARMSLRKETPLIQIIDTPILPLPKKVTSKTKYLLIGGILSAAFIVCVLSLRRLVRSLS